MDEFNNNNPFDEQKPDNTQDPYNQQAQQGQNPYAQGGQNMNHNMPQNPYNQQQGDPYNQQAQQGQQGNPYNQQPGQNPYAMPSQGNPYSQQPGQNPYAMPQQMPYVQGAYGTAYQPYQNQSTGMAVASLILGIISILLSLFVFAAPFLIILPIIGLILGIVFKSKHLPVGRGLSTAGIITSVCGIVFPVLILILFTVLLMNHAMDGFMSDMLQQIKATDPELYQQYYDMLGDSFPEWFEGVLFVLGLK